MVEESAAEAAAAALGQLEVGEKPEEVAGSSETENLTVSEDGPKEEENEDGPPNGTAKRDKTNSSQRVIAKFLMSNAAAGSIIGKAGANITELQNQSSARLQLSRANEFFPGTEDRVLICSGTMNQVLTALHLVLSRVQTELATGDTAVEDSQRTNLRLLLPSALCGVLIGKGGATIRSFSQDSDAAITVSAQNAQLPGVSDRVVRITGTQSQLMRALALILSKLLESPHYPRLASVPVNYSSGPIRLGGWGQFPPQMMSMPPMTARGAPPPPSAPLQQPMPPPTVMGGRAELMIPIPDVRIGAVIGKGGEIITQLKTLVGVKIRISDRDNFVPGTRDRKVHISGTPEAVQIASALIHQKVASAAGPPRVQQ